jgi:hypothetical protein
MEKRRKRRFPLVSVLPGKGKDLGFRGGLCFIGGRGALRKIFFLCFLYKCPGICENFAESGETEHRNDLFVLFFVFFVFAYHPNFLQSRFQSFQGTFAACFLLLAQKRKQKREKSLEIPSFGAAAGKACPIAGAELGFTDCRKGMGKTVKAVASFS